jgi:THO complex subunit 1
LPSRFTKPSADSLLNGIANDELDIDMAMTDNDKNMSINAKSSKTWRTLRIASKSKLNLFDKVDDGKNLKVLFERHDSPKAEDHPEIGNLPEKSVVTKDKENTDTPPISVESARRMDATIGAPGAVAT